MANFLFVPIIAKKFGRVPLPRTKTENIIPVNFWYPLFFRNYTSIELNQTLKNISKEFNSKYKIQIVYLDACFPFIKGFPLLPHLSHNDGDKIDLSFIYTDKNGQLTTKKRSYTGYGIFEEPNSKEVQMTELCKRKGFRQYDFTKYLTGPKNTTVEFNRMATRDLIISILKQQSVKKVFIEPHLINQLSIDSNKLKFHGCQAVRHDDHIHLQLN
ncbi:hypothetical protein [Urechidicola sp. KH5]